jgi:hypothetical protein
LRGAKHRTYRKTENISNSPIHRKPAGKGGISRVKRGKGGKGGGKVGWKKNLGSPISGRWEKIKLKF